MKSSTVLILSLCLVGILIHVLAWLGGLPGWMLGEGPFDQLAVWQKAVLPVTMIAGRLGSLSALVMLYLVFVKK